MPRIRLVHTSSFRLALLYAGLFAASVAILFGLIYWSAADYAARDQADELGVESAAIEDEARLAGNDHLPEIIANHLRQRKSERVIYLLEDASGHKFAGNIPEMAPTVGPMTIGAVLDGRRREMLAHGYRLANGDYLAIGEDPFFLREMKEFIARAFGLSMLATLSLAVLGGLVISRSVLGRVEAVSRTSRAIIAGDLSQRVPLRGTGDEFDRLSAAVNAMLDRIEDLMKSMRQVSNDVAHDLRTPLTRLRQRLEHARRRGGTVGELHDALDGSIEQVDTILETFGALLRIAQVEAGGRTAPFGEIDVSKLLAGIVDDFTPAAEDRGQSLQADIAPGLTVPGDRELLVQMVVNLVDNAIRHCRSGARITVQARRVAGAVELGVADTGPGIPVEERDNVLRPFYRLEASRTTEGSGLGLSLVAAIAKLHKAHLALSDREPGLQVLATFPVDKTSL